MSFLHFSNNLPISRMTTMSLSTVLILFASTAVISSFLCEVTGPFGQKTFTLSPTFDTTGSGSSEYANSKIHR